MTQANILAQAGSQGTTTGFKNRIINGAMVIDQRNAGASVTPTINAYTLDRWHATLNQASKYSIQQNAGSVTPPVGFANYLGVTSLSAYSVGASDSFTIRQLIEGYNVADLGWGTADAKTITISFWVRSSLIGTFGGSLKNSDSSRSYPYSYTISSANTWEQKSITVSGDTTGTWLTTNGTGLIIGFGLGVGSTLSGTAGAWTSANYTSATGATSVVGTNGATFYITGVQLEVGTTATSFDFRNYGTELALCQRYYYRITYSSQMAFGQVATAIDATTGYILGAFPVTLRTAPTAVEQTGTASNYTVYTGGIARACSIVPSYSGVTSTSTWGVITTVASGQTAGQSGFVYPAPAVTAYLGWSAEL